LIERDEHIKRLYTLLHLDSVAFDQNRESHKEIIDSMKQMVDMIADLQFRVGMLEFEKKEQGKKNGQK
jgi:hypothetical protein